MDQQELGIEYLKAVHRYFTPIGVGVVLCGLIFNPGLPPGIFNGCIALLVISLVFNVHSAAGAMDHPAGWKRRGYVRAATNLLLNSMFYILLHEFWPTVWVLFALGPVAIALYGDASETFGVLGIVALVMMGCLLADGNLDPRAWSEVGAQAFFILLLSLFLIKVSALIHRQSRPSESRAVPPHAGQLAGRKA